MNNTTPLVVRFSIAFAGACLVTAVAAPVMAQDKAKPAAAAPAKAAQKDQRDRKVILDNEKVIVTENIYKPGASSAMTERGVRVTRALSDGTLERTWPDGRKETIKWKSGDVRYGPKETFIQKNVGKTDLHLYTVTLK